MRRSQVVTAAAVAVLVTGVGVAVARHDRGTNGPQASPSPTPTTTSSATTTPSTAASSSTRPSPQGSGPRDQEYDVVYATTTTTQQGAEAVAAAGGEVVHENAAAGVVSVMAGPDFLAKAQQDTRIYGAVANPASGLPPAKDDPSPVLDGSGPTRTGAGRNGNDPLADLQWDMDLIHAPQARGIEAGDPRVLVAVIDTGVDRTHPDLAKAYDTGLSRNFVTDYPGMDGPCETKDCHDPIGVDEVGHGTHVAGTIVAAADGFGMNGIAPGVRLVDLRAGQDSGLFLLMATVDALTYAGDIGVDVANLSYFVDPWLYNCPNGADDSPTERYEQRALIEGTRRAVDYAYRKGVTLVAAAGNEHDDLDVPRLDTISPDFPDGAAKRRRLTDDCIVLPTELPHVIQVSALARDGLKSDYSDYGLTHITVTAPGGSTLLADGRGPSASYQTLSTYPRALARQEGQLGPNGEPRSPGVVRYCRGSTCGYYRYLIGTSMASPHAAGVAALVVSRYGTADPAHPGQLRLDPARVLRILRDTATPKACPDPPRLVYARRPAVTATCRGTKDHNGFYGDGLVDARAAVSP